MSSLEARIAARLNEVLDHQLRGGFTAESDRGMVAGGEMLLSVEDVARIAALVAGAPADQIES